jgi:hypothetical protein
MRTAARAAPATTHQPRQTAAQHRGGAVVSRSPTRGAHSFGGIAVHAPVAAAGPAVAVNEPGGRDEREADSVADLVMRLGDADVPREMGPRTAAGTPMSVHRHVQRTNRSPTLQEAIVPAKGDDEDAERQEVQALRDPAPIGGATGVAPAVSAAALESSDGAAPLDAGARRFMEPRFGADFSRVLVHNDARAAALSTQLSARAFTFRHHIYFNDGEYRPDTSEGRHVLAHELTHVIQQEGGETSLPMDQRVRAGAGPAAAPMIQRISDRGKLLASDVKPWKDEPPKGSNFEVSTDAGSKVVAWVPYFVYEDQYLYWCHGHALGTFERFSYSVYSGVDVGTVVKDEWTQISSATTKAGDIAVWTADLGHSALFKTPVIEKGKLNPDKSILSTKNGPQPQADKTLTDIAGTYGTKGIGVFRHK